jgi:simple sugar transport system ATP-binding protein
MKNITKVYQPTNIVANNAANLSLERGEIRAVVGENGAGKSTLMKILYGEEHADEGQILFDGREVCITNPMAAKKLGIGMVHQEFKLFPSLSVSENIVLGQEPRKKGFFFDRKKANKLIGELSKKYELPIEAAARVDSLSVGQKQCVEILKMLYCGAKVLIMDEPTAVLTEQEVNALFETLRKLASAGHSIIIITHKIPEIMTISNRVSIMRSGKIEATRETDGISEKEICDLMIGKDYNYDIQRLSSKVGKSILSIKDLIIQEKTGSIPKLDRISFDVHAGEVFGIAGVTGNGQAELLEAVFGLREVSSGTISINDTPTIGFGPIKIRNLGVSYVPGERTIRGAALQGGLWENILVFSLKKFSRHFLLNSEKIRESCDGRLKNFGVKAENSTIKAQTLSGGNLQKVVLCREFEGDPDLLIIEEPTRGLDVKSANFVYEQILLMRGKNCAILIVSSDLNELLLLSDKLAVMYKGKIAVIMENDKTLSPLDIGEYMMGIKQTEDCG